ncbi:MAG: BREX system Lon protease-like protein BrxL, partial [Huintestinicola sp.]
MFKSERYLTQGVNAAIPIVLQLVMWKMISDIPAEKDYLQVFRLSGENGIQTIIHEQEQPAYKKIVSFQWPEAVVTQKVFVIDDGDHCTMLLAEEYCSSDEPEIIEKGVEAVKKILSDNYVRPDEAQKILSLLRKRGSYTVIDKITVNLNIRKDIYEAEFSNLGLKGISIEDEYPEKFDRLLCGGIWCIVQLEYGEDDQFEFADTNLKKKNQDSFPIKIRKLTPIQMPHVDINDLKAGRKAFSKDEWIDIMLRSCGYEPDELKEREKWLLLARMIPLVENNYNLCELGPRSTGKSHIYKEISPNSILVSGGQTTVANLFYNMSKKAVGLVGLWDCVAFDEVAGINFKDKDGIQIMKDYMASGSFARGKEEKAASASMVFVGNINQSVDVLLKTSSLFDPFPPEMGTDTAFLDRMHCYVPGWEIPKFRPEHFTDDYGFITDY